MTMAQRARPPRGLMLKLSRARKQLRQLRRTSERHFSRQKVRWERRQNDEGTHYVYRLITTDPPESIQILADEAVHHLRSVLDHLVTGFVEATGRTFSGDLGFPLLIKKPSTSKEINSFEKSIGNIKGPARQLIVDSQPYQRGDAAKMHPLWILSRLDNRFKHTSLHLLVYRVSAPDVPGIIRHRGADRGGALENGDVFAEVPIRDNVHEEFEKEITVTVSIGSEYTDIEGFGLGEIEDIYNFVRDEVFRKAIRGRLPRRIKRPPL